jgi:hypothetical protein
MRKARSKGTLHTRHQCKTKARKLRAWATSLLEGDRGEGPGEGREGVEEDGEGGGV